MKNLILLMLLSLIWVQASSQTIDNVQEIASIAPVTGSSPDIPSFYEWEEVSNTTQGANIHLAQTEIRDIYLQQNNHNLAFNLLGTSSFINKLEVNYDDTGWVTIHDNGNTQSVGWENTPNFFNSIGFHNLKVRYFNQSPTSPFFREYSVVVIPECEKFYRDNTKSTDPAVFTTGNTLTLWNEASTPNAKPMLIVEGYDAINSYYPERYRAAGIEWFPRVYELGYEIYLLNFNLANQDLKNNAAVVHSAIEYISSITNGQDVAVAGVSRGMAIIATESAA